MKKILLLMTALCCAPVSGWTQSAGNLNLSGPSTGGTLITPQTVNAGVNAALTSKANAVNPRITGTEIIGDDTTVTNFLLDLDGAATGARKIQWQTAGLGRWDMGVSVNAESGSNVGSDFSLQRRNDAGTIIDQPLTISRASGLATFLQGITVNGTATFNGPLTGSSATLTGILTGTSATLTGNLTGTSATLSGNLNGTSATLSGNLNGTSATFSGNFTAANITSTTGSVTVGGNTITNPALVLNGTGQGQVGVRFLAGNVNRWRLISADNETGVNNAGSDLILQSYTDAGVGFNLLSINRSSGLFKHSAQGLFHQTVSDSIAGETGLTGWLSMTGGGRFRNRIGGTFQTDNIGYVPTLDPAWAAGTAYNIGDIANANGELIQATTSGTSGSTMPPCAPNIDTCSDDVVNWKFLGALGGAYQMIGGFMSANIASSFGGVPGAPIGVVFGFNTQANISVPNTDGVVGYEVNYGSAFPVKSRVGVQIIGGLKGTAQASDIDVALRIGSQGGEGGGGFAPLKHLFDLGGNTTGFLLDPNGYAIRVYGEGWNQGVGAAPQMMVGAGGIDFTEFQPSGVGPFGGGFILRGPGSQILGSGDFQSNYALLHQSSTGASLDVSQYHVTAATIHPGGGGAHWAAAGWLADCTDGSIVKPTVITGDAVSAVTLFLGAYSNVPPGTVTCTSEQFVGVHDGSGGSVIPDPIQVDLTASLANAGSPILTLGGIANTVSIQPTGGTTLFGGALKVAAATMAANSTVATTMSSLGPVGAHTTVQEWLKVTNSAGVVRYIPAY